MVERMLTGLLTLISYLPSKSQGCPVFRELLRDPYS